MVEKIMTGRMTSERTKKTGLLDFFPAQITLRLISIGGWTPARGAAPFQQPNETHGACGFDDGRLQRNTRSASVGQIASISPR